MTTQNTPIGEIPITIAKGDGIGPEIMDAALSVLRQSGAALSFEEIEIGRAVYERGHSSGIEPSAWESLRRAKVFLKAPITTPLGGGYKSLNVTIRKTLGLYANVRPCVSLHPLIATKHPAMDVVIVRENEEDLYAGIEYRQSWDCYHAVKIASTQGTERIVRFAFEYAKRNNRKKVTCLSKNNILKLTDGLFARVFESIGAEYPDLEKEHLIIDIGAARLADTPQNFDVVVTANLYGDIVSDITAQIAGSVGLVGSANIGIGCSMFEAIHGSAPMIAGQNKANPSGLLHAAVMMLVHLDQPEIASRVHNAWLRTLEQGVHTFDIYTEGISRRLVGTKEFGEAVSRNLGRLPEVLKPVSYAKEQSPLQVYSTEPAKLPTQELVGADVYVTFPADGIEELVERLQAPELCTLTFVTNRGLKVWPDGAPETFCTTQWRCRFMSKSNAMTQRELLELLTTLTDRELLIGKVENLYTFDGEKGYSAGQGE